MHDGVLNFNYKEQQDGILSTKEQVSSEDHSHPGDVYYRDFQYDCLAKDENIKIL